MLRNASDASSAGKHGDQSADHHELNEIGPGEHHEHGDNRYPLIDSLRRCAKRTYPPP